MKKRIFSLLLALVMMFSCMSLSIFATETPDAQAASEEKTYEATEIPCKDAASILGDKLIFADDFDNGQINATNYLTNFGTAGGYATTSGTSSILKSPGHKSGESYVISFDMKTDGSKQYYPFYTINSASGGTPFYPITVLEDGTIGYYTMYDTGPKVTNLDYKMPLNTFCRLDFVHHVTENTYDLYIDGERLVAGIVASDTDNFTFKDTVIHIAAVDNFKMYYSDVNLECGHNVIGDTCEWCGKVFKTTVGSHNHTISKTPASAQIIACKDAASILGDDLIFAVDFDNITLEDPSVTPYLTGFQGSRVDANGNISYYDNATLKSPGHKSGETYVLSFDFKNDGKTQYYPLYTVSSTTGGAGMYPITIAPSGQFGYYEYDGSMKCRWTDIYLEQGKFYKIDFVHFVAKNTYDLYIDGKQVVTGIAPTNTNNFTFGSTQFNVAEVDNIKMYYADTNLECAHSFSTSATCDWCGKTCEGFEFAACDVCNGSVISEGAAVVEKSVSINEKIDMNVYMAISDELINNANAKVVLECGHRSAEYALADAVAEENGLYKFSIGLTSAQMAQDVKVKVVGEISNTYTTTVKAYAEELIASSENASAVALAKAMLNYGAASQVYFAEWNGDDTIDDVLANAGLDEADKAVTDITGTKPFNAISYAPYTKGEDVEFTAATIMFSSKTHINVFFTASDEAIVTVDGKQVVPNASEYRGEYYVTFTVDSPADIMEGIQIVVTDGESMAAQEFSAALLIKVGVASDELDDSFKDLLKAYAYYAMCAATYVA